MHQVTFNLVPTDISWHNHCITPKSPLSVLTGADYVIVAALIELLFSNCTVVL